jgi:phage tail sheath protein FI
MLDGSGIDLLCIPPDLRLGPTVPLSAQDLDPTVRQQAAEYCTNNRAIYIADPPAIWATQVQNGEISDISPDDLEISGVSASGIEYERNVAVYFPRVYKEDLLAPGVTALFAACGAVAGSMAANDVARGVWKAPAGTSVGLAGVSSLEVALTDVHSGYLNPIGINCLRTFPLAGTVIWGARTLRGADILQDDYKYLSVRRLTLYIESSLYQSTQWAVFEPNDEALWSSLRLSVGSFLAQLSQQGAFYNYAVTCDSTTTTVADIEAGRVNILVQIAPVDPAEFVMIQIQQVAPQLAG